MTAPAAAVSASTRAADAHLARSLIGAPNRSVGPPSSPTPVNNLPASPGSGGMGGSGGRANPPTPAPVGGSGGTTASPTGPVPDAGSATPDAGRDVNRPPGPDGGPATSRDSGAGDQSPTPPPDAGAAATPPTGFVCPAGPFGNPLPADRNATLIRANAGSLEGPVWVASQNALYYCVVAGVLGMGRIDKYDPATNQIAPFVTGVDVAGLALTPQGLIVAASFDSRNLTTFDPVTGTRTSLPNSDRFNGQPLNQTNDLVVRSDGNIYFTDTNYRQDGRPGQDTTAYYRYSADQQLTRLGAGPFPGSNPNGIALSPDGHFLYVAFSEGGPTRRQELDGTGGPIGMPVVFTNLPSDGLAVDCAGNVYLSTAGAIRVFAPNGLDLGTITVPGGGTRNSAFGGGLAMPSWLLLPTWG